MLSHEHRSLLAANTATNYAAESVIELFVHDSEYPLVVAYDLGMATVDAFFEDRRTQSLLQAMDTDDRREEIQAEIDLVRDEAGREIDGLEESEGWKRAISIAQMQATELMRPPWER